MDYEQETRLAYTSELRAKAYKEQYTKGMKWARLTMRRERIFIEKTLRQCNLKKTDRILDIPCGTGTLAGILSKFPSRIVAVDISREMMELAHEEYWGEHFNGFIQADISKTPFRERAFACVIAIGFLHRVPADIRRLILKEIISLSKRFIIISYSIDSSSQRLKQWIIKKIRPTHRSAPSPLPLSDIVEELSHNGIMIKKVFHLAYFLSSEVVLLLEKNSTCWS